jgi:hypothetical protein
MAAKPTKPVEVMPLEQYIKEHEDAAQKTGLVVTKIVHPQAENRVYPGRYAGIVLIEGELSATYCDGSKH